MNDLMIEKINDVRRDIDKLFLEKQLDYKDHRKFTKSCADIIKAINDWYILEKDKWYILTELTLTKQLQQIVSDCAYINADPDNRFSQKVKDQAQRDVTKMLNYVEEITNKSHIDMLIKKAKIEKLHLKMEEMRKNNLENLEKWYLSVNTVMRMR